MLAFEIKNGINIWFTKVSSVLNWIISRAQYFQLIVSNDHANSFIFLHDKDKIAHDRHHSQFWLNAVSLILSCLILQQ